MPATGFYFVSESQTFKQSEFSSVSKFSLQEINRKRLVKSVTLQEISSSEGNLTKAANFHRCIKKMNQEISAKSSRPYTTLREGIGMFLLISAGVLIQLPGNYFYL